MCSFSLQRCVEVKLLPAVVCGCEASPYRGVWMCSFSLQRCVDVKFLPAEVCGCEASPCRGEVSPCRGV